MHYSYGLGPKLNETYPHACPVVAKRRQDKHKCIYTGRFCQIRHLDEFIPYFALFNGFQNILSKTHIN